MVDEPLELAVDICFSFLWTHRCCMILHLFLMSVSKRPHQATAYLETIRHQKVGDDAISTVLGVQACRPEFESQNLLLKPTGHCGTILQSQC